MLFLLVNSDDLSHLWKVAWKLKILLKEAWNVDDTTYTSELQNVTITLPFMSKVFDNINVQKVFRGAYEEHVHPEIRSAITEKLPLICYKYGTTLAQEFVDVKRWGKLSKEKFRNFKCACHTSAMKPYIRTGTGHVCTTDPSIVAAAVPGSMRLDS